MDVVEGLREVLVVVELLAGEALGLALVRRDEHRLGARPQPQGLAFGVQHGLDLALVEIANRLGVEVLGDTAGQGAGEHDRVGTARQVVDLLAQQLELLGLDVRAPFVHLGVGGRSRVDNGGRRAGLGFDAHEVVQDRLAGQVLDDALTGPAPGEPGRDHRDVEELQRPGDVDPRAAGQREPCARTVSLAALEVRHGQRAVERGVQGDGDDQETQLQTLRPVSA